MHSAPPLALRILCAEDDPLEGRALAHILQLEGYAVELAPDGRTARDQICRDVGHFGLLITDHQMPGLTGSGLAQEVRAAGFTGRIIVHSSQLGSQEQKSYEGCDVAAFVEKVSGVAVLLGAIVNGHGKSGANGSSRGGG